MAERNRELNSLNDKVETIKQQMEERGSSMTDGSMIYCISIVLCTNLLFVAPLVNIKKTLVQIKGEITDMDVRIGVLECLLLQTKIREERQLEQAFDPSVSVY